MGFILLILPIILFVIGGIVLNARGYKKARERGFSGSFSEYKDILLRSTGATRNQHLKIKDFKSISKKHDD